MKLPRGNFVFHPMHWRSSINVKIVGTTLVIEIPLNSSPVPSPTGKSLVVASTNGNTTTEAKVAGKNVVIGLNAYIPKGRARRFHVSSEDGLLSWFFCV